MTSEKILTSERTARLLDQIERELEVCDVLKGLARSQAELMKVRDVKGLEQNAVLWEENLARVQTLRDEQVAEIRAVTGADTPDLDALAVRCDPEAQRRLKVLRSRRRGMAEELTRQTELNRRLARFCLDLLGDEMSVFKRGLEETAGGCYDDRGERQGHGAGGVVRHQA